MNAREKIDELKELWGLRTDEEIANKLEIPKNTINTWIRRGAIPEKWELKIGQMNQSTSSQPANTLNSHIADREMEIIKAFRELSADKQELYYYKIKAEAAEERIKNQEQPTLDAKYA